MTRTVPKQKKGQKRRPRQANNKNTVDNGGIGEGGKTMRKKESGGRSMHPKNMGRKGLRTYKAWRNIREM